MAAWYPTGVPTSRRINPELERFIADNIESEESLFLLLALRSERRRWTLVALREYVGVALDPSITAEQPMLVEKRFELRLRELERKGLVHVADESTSVFEYAVPARSEGLVDALVDAFSRDRFAVNRIIYGITSRARVLADSFRL